MDGSGVSGEVGSGEAGAAKTGDEPEPDIVNDMLSCDVVKPSNKFKANLAKKSQNLSDQDKAKIADMVKGLSKYREIDMEEEDLLDGVVVSPKKFKKSPYKDQRAGRESASGSSLQEYLKSEMDSVTASLEAATAKKVDTESKAKVKPDVAKAEATGDDSSKGDLGGSSSISSLPEFKFNFNPPHVDLCAAFDKVQVGQEDQQAKGKKKKKNKEKKAQKETPKDTVELELETPKELYGGKAAKGKQDKTDKQGAQRKGGKVGSYSQLLHTMGRPSRDDPAFTGQFERLQVSVGESDRVVERSTSPKGDYSGGKQRKDKSKSPKKQELAEQRLSPQPRKLSADSASSQNSARAGKAALKDFSKEGTPELSPKKTKKQMKKERREAERAQSGKKSRSEEKDWRSSMMSKHDLPMDRSRDYTDNKRTKASPTGVSLDEETTIVLKGNYRFTDFPAGVSLDEETTVRVIVPKDDHRFVMGPQRVNLIDICNMTGVMIEVPTKTEPSEEVVLRGDKLQVGPALALMFSKLQQSKMEAMCSPAARPKEYVPPNQHFRDNYNPKVKGQGQGQPPPQRRGEGHLDYDLVSQNKNQNANRGQGQGHGGRNQFRGQGQGQVGVREFRQDRGQYQGPSQMPYQREGTPERNDEQGKNPKSQGKRQRKKKNMFADYLPMEEVSAGLKRGILIQGPVRINPKQFEEAYVPHPDGKSDIMISGLPDRNRALNGDEVAVILHEEEDWLLRKNALQDIEDSQKIDLDNTADGEAEVVIEGEEVVEVMNTAKSNTENKTTSASSAGRLEKTDTDSATQQQQNKNVTPGQKSKAKGGHQRECHRDRYTSLGEVMSGGSPAARKALGTDGSEAARKLVQRTGKVVAIIEKKHSRACSGHIKMHSHENALFLPADHRMPRLLIPISECPKELLERPEDHAQTLYVARMTDWRKDSVYADGCLVKSLGLAGEIEPETEGMLIENGVDFDDFPAEALECLPVTPWSIDASEIAYRRDFRKACVFTIDPATARDLDDALSCEDLGDGRYKVGVHIADVSYFIPEDCDLDKVAASRATSVYLIHKVIPMLPRLLCEELCSLNPDQDRLSFSVEWTISEDGEIEDEWFGRSLIRSCVKLTYDHAQGFIEQPDREWTHEELPPISEGFTIEDIKTRTLQLHKIAKNLRRARFDGGALRLDQVKLQYSLDKESGMPNGYSVYHQRDSNRLVEEFMLLANMAVAHRINTEFPDKALLRRHPEPQEKMIENLRDQCSTLGIQLDISSAGALQRSLYNYCDGDEYSRARMQVLTALCSKPMQNAKYFCNGCIDDESLYRHYALNVPLYTHFTSPIRRYPDILVHRALAASLDYADETRRAPTVIHKLAEHCNDKKTAAKRCGDLSSELFFSVFVKTTGPLEEKAMVMAVFDKAFDIFVLKLGVSKRVYCNRLGIKEKIYRTDRKVPSLTLVWPSTEEGEECSGGGGEPEMRQEVTVFTVVDCVLDQGDLPLQWTAIIKRPPPVKFPVMNV